MRKRIAAVLVLTLVMPMLFRASRQPEDTGLSVPGGYIESFLPLFNVEQTPAPEEDTSPRRFTLVVAGDLMVHGEQLEDAYRQQQDAYDFSHCFAQVAPDLQEGYAVGNLETVLGGAEIGYSDYPRFNTPDSYAQALLESGFDFVTTANNHCMDKGEAGLLRTLETLDRLGIAHTGTFASRQERDSICIQEVEGVRIAFLAYTFSTNGIPVPEGKEYLVNMIEQKLILQDLNRARELEPDLIVVLPHMGNEYELEPRVPFEDWMDFMMKNGADVILASHPHVLQEMQVKGVDNGDGTSRNAFVIYSLGNFISSQRYENLECSILLKLDFVKQGKAPAALERVRFVPTWVQFRDEAGAYLVRVLPVLDAIEDYENENSYCLTVSNADRLYRVHDWITSRYLGEAPPRDSMQREYVFYENIVESK